MWQGIVNGATGWKAEDLRVCEENGADRGKKVAVVSR